LYGFPAPAPAPAPEPAPASAPGAGGTRASLAPTPDAEAGAGAGEMAIETTYTHARANLNALLDEVTENREIVIIRRRDGDDVALIAADELRGLIEMVHLLRSPRNAERLLSALRSALKT
jgi:antitoxin YefM